MFRLFVAIRPPAAIINQLLDMTDGVDGARWQDEEQLHITLRFIGEVDGHTGEDIAAALRVVSQPAFDLGLSGVGAFQHRGRAALWAGLSPPAPLQSLHKKVAQACLRVGLAPEGRAYHPHLTLARLGSRGGPIQPFLQRWAGLSSADFHVGSFGLYRSELHAAGASHTIVERYPLR